MVSRFFKELHPILGNGRVISVEPLTSINSEQKLPSFTGFYRVLPGFTAFLSRFTGFNLIFSTDLSASGRDFVI